MTRHSIAVVRHRDDYSSGYYATCSCGWEGITASNRRTARRDGDRHLDHVAPPPEQPALPGLEEVGR